MLGGLLIDIVKSSMNYTKLLRPVRSGITFNGLKYGVRTKKSNVIYFSTTSSTYDKSESSSYLSNPQMKFPCLDQMEEKTNALSNSNNNTPILHSSLKDGPEPSYQKVQTGFKLYKCNDPIFLDHGGYLPEYEIAYETWGQLTPQKDNIILIHTGLSASSHAKSQPDNPKPGWWENFIGPDKYLDTNKFFIICTNILGSCYGTTGPSSKDPANGDFYGTKFPIITVNDMVRSQRQLIKDVFGVTKIYASVGASMGGMQSLAYAWEFPDEVDKVISISGCARSHPYSIALRHTQRQILMSDPNWKRGFYYNGIPPHIGMKLAREVATITYRSGPEWEYRFGRNRADDSKAPAFCPDFLVETYLDHAGEKFCLEYDANSLLYILKAMDLFDLSLSNREAALKTRSQTEHHYYKGVKEESVHCSSIPDKPYQEKVTSATVTPEEAFEDLKKGMAKIAHKDFLVVGVESDSLFPVFQQREINNVLKANDCNNVKYFELGTDISNYGHDTFLLSLDNIGKPVKEFL